MNIKDYNSECLSQSSLSCLMKLERLDPPTRREAWMRMGQFLSAAALWSSDLAVQNFPTMDPETTAAWAVPLESFPIDEFTLVTHLGKSRIGEIPDASLISQESLRTMLSGDGWSFSNREPMYFPQFLFGAWNVTATLRQNLNMPKCDERYMVDLDPHQHADIYQIQFFATLANTWRNQLAVNLGSGIPETKVIANRAYNLPTELNLIGWNANVSSDIDWDYRSTYAPTRVTWTDADHRGYERDVLECFSESFAGDERVFAATKRHRIQAQTNGSVKMKVDTETTTEYHLVSDNHVQAFSRIVVFPSKISASRFQNPACPASITVLDYELSMHRVMQPFRNLLNDDLESRPCVETPKGIIQCY